MRVCRCDLPCKYNKNYTRCPKGPNLLKYCILKPDQTSEYWWSSEFLPQKEQGPSPQEVTTGTRDNIGISFTNKKIFNCWAPMMNE
jgi:hypothetical protein